MRYIPKEGILLTKICNENILITPSRYRETCPRALLINETAAEIWKLLDQKKSDDEIIDYFRTNYETDDIDLMTILVNFENEMFERGYLIYEENK